METQKIYLAGNSGNGSPTSRGAWHRAPQKGALFYVLARDVESERKRTRHMDSLSDYKAVLAAVSRATGIPEAFIFSRRKGQIYYDARWIAVRLLADLGYYSGQIAELTGMTQRNINRIISTIQFREFSTWRQFGNELDACRKALGITAAS